MGSFGFSGATLFDRLNPWSAIRPLLLHIYPEKRVLDDEPRT